jgi:hypothetical protein
MVVCAINMQLIIQNEHMSQKQWHKKIPIEVNISNIPT